MPVTNRKRHKAAAKRRKPFLLRKPVRMSRSVAPCQVVKPFTMQVQFTIVDAVGNVFLDHRSTTVLEHPQVAMNVLRETRRYLAQGQRELSGYISKRKAGGRMK